MTDYATLIPVNVLTGFLGSGKTTLLGQLLTMPGMSGVAVLVNEFGEVGLDHHLLEPVAETTLLLDNGCLCCAIRGDLQDALRDLFSRRERGEIPPFDRVVIETSGLADPVPIAYTLLSEPVLQHHFRLGNVVATVDTLTGARQLDRYPESVKQVAVADRLVLTKTDLGDEERRRALRGRLRRLNPSAPVLDATLDGMDPKRLFLDDVYQAGAKEREVARWTAQSGRKPEPRGSEARGHDHEGGIHSFCLRFEGALDWTAFGIWLTMLLHRHGDKVLRVKGVLNVAGVSGPVLVNGVQHIVHPASHLGAWPDEDRSSRIVFIVRELERERLETSLRTFAALADAAA